METASDISRTINTKPSETASGDQSSEVKNESPIKSAPSANAVNGAKNEHFPETAAGEKTPTKESW